jgi:hypothetical protein
LVREAVECPSGKCAGHDPRAFDIVRLLAPCARHAWFTIVAGRKHKRNDSRHCGVFGRDRLRVRFEESEHRDCYGARYDAYAARVPRFIPRLGAQKTQHDTKMSWRLFLV